MDDIRQRIARLDSDRARLLERRLRERGAHPDELGPQSDAGRPVSSGERRWPKASVFFFSADDAAPAASKYDFLLAMARRADERGFWAIWTPERHYDRFGGLYPSPAVLGAAIAAVTRRIAIRAGSVVLPLHDPLRIAEEWSVVDNLSGGRVGLSLAPGFHPRDFAGRRADFERRRELLADSLQTLRSVWQRDSVRRELPDGTFTELRLYPKPVQPQLPIWLTAASSAQTFIQAGQNGTNVLTALMGHDLDQLAEKIKQYRNARAAMGLDPAGGVVTVMVHTYLASSEEEVERVARPAFKNYLSTHVEFAAAILSKQQKEDLSALGERDRQAVLERAFNRYRAHRSLIGTREYCRDMLTRLARAGVDEVGCLLDFGIDADAAALSVDRLAALIAEQSAVPREAQ